MKINRKLLPVKAHYFFFMAAMGPILPQLQVYGKELGISSVVMGSVTGILPFAFLLAKPAFGLIVDVYRDYRKTIFMTLIVIMSLSYAIMSFIPARPKLDLNYRNLTMTSLDTCNATDITNERECSNKTVQVLCTSSCLSEPGRLLAIVQNSSRNYKLCSLTGNLSDIFDNSTCDMNCTEDIETDNGCLYETLTFWSFIILMSVGTIGFNVINSISDAICFDVIGEEYDYGKQRVWGTIGFGLTALISGYVVDTVSGSRTSYAPAFIILTICSAIDLIACVKLKLPIIPAPENIFKDLQKLMNNRYVITFITFAVFAGILDSLLIYFLFWHLQDLAIATGTSNIKLIEGLIVAAETLGGEVIFFSISGRILERFGHVHSFSMCFIFYALRLGLISVAPSPWWVVPIEFFLQGPTYALMYTTIVAYANELAPPGTSATMQGIAAGMDDGVGYAIGSILGGLLYKYLGGKHTMQVFSAFGVICSIVHLVLHKTLLTRSKRDEIKDVPEYKSPEDALKVTYDDGVE